VEQRITDAGTCAYATDVWSDDKHQSKVVACSVVHGFPYWENVITPKGERHTKEFMLETCKPGLARKENIGVVSDSPTGMTAFRKAVLEESKGTKVAVGCAFHWVDKACGDIQGKGPQDAVGFAIPDLVATANSSSTMLCKGIVKLMNLRNLPNGLLKMAREKENRVRRAEKERLVPSLRMQGDTRSTSIATMYNSVAANRDVMRAVVSAEKWDEFFDNLQSDKDAAKNDKLKVRNLVEKIKSRAAMDRIADFGKALALMQVYQRVLEKRQKTLSDLTLDFFEFCARVEALPESDAITAEVKQKMVDAMKYRYDLTGYSPAAALALLLDPRGGFNGRTFNLPQWWCSKYSYERDAEQVLEKLVSDQTPELRDKIMAQYNDLLLGRCFDVNDPDDVHILDSANDMPLWQWYKRKARASCRELFLFVAAKLAHMPITADGCEHGNSLYKWVQAGRVSLGDDIARMLVYIVINMRMLKLHKEFDSAECVKGGYRRCWGWPPAERLEEDARTEVDGEADPAVAVLHANLVDGIAQLAADAEAAAAASRTSPRLARKRARSEMDAVIEIDDKAAAVA
jgi:hypothetical protein